MDYTVRGQSNVWRLPKYWPPTPLTARRRGDTLARGRGGGGSIFWKTPDTALYSTYVITLWPGAFYRAGGKAPGPTCCIWLMNSRKHGTIKHSGFAWIRGDSCSIIFMYSVCKTCPRRNFVYAIYSISTSRLNFQEKESWQCQRLPRMFFHQLCFILNFFFHRILFSRIKSGVTFISMFLCAPQRPKICSFFIRNKNKHNAGIKEAEKATNFMETNKK